MFARKGVLSSIGRAAALPMIAVVAFSVIDPATAVAGSAPAGKALSAAADGATDFSARRRYHRGGSAAAAAAFAAIVGTGLAIAAAQNRRAYYDDYYGGPVYYSLSPYYYGDGPYYGGYRSGVPYYRGHPLASW